VTNTTVCAYCASVIPAGAKTCRMCGADNKPDYLEEIVAPPPVVKPTPVQPLEPATVAEPVWEMPASEPLPALDRSAPPSASPARYIWILVGVVAVVLVCLCVAAVLIANLVFGV